MQLFSNNASTTLAAGLSAAATSMSVTASAGFVAIPAGRFELVTLEAGAAREIVKVTARSGNTWTIVRGQEGSAALAWASGATVEARLTAGALGGMMQKVEYPDLSGLNQAGNARSASAINLQRSRDDVDQVASGPGSVVIGNSAKATQNFAVAIGGYASATRLESLALGSSAQADGQDATALGGGSRARGERSTALNGAWVFPSRAIGIWGFAALPAEDWNDQWEVNASGVRAAFATPYMDLALGATWQASALVEHGDVVRPTSGGAVQYRAWCDYSSDTWRHITPTTDAVEPEWPGAGGDVEINATDNAAWIGIDLSEGYETTSFPDWLTFQPTEILFICQKYAATSGSPTVSIGIPGAPALIVDAEPVTVDAVGQTFQFALPNPCPGIAEGGSMLITLDSAPVSGVMLGRFIVSGFFIETKSRA
jgi:hypothetical protein